MLIRHFLLSDTELCPDLQDEPASDWPLETSACHVYAADESGATVRLVCIPVSQLDLDTSALNCTARKFNHFLQSIEPVWTLDTYHFFAYLA